MSIGWRSAALLAAGIAMGGSAIAQTEPCGLCARAVVTNSALATCFLDQYDALSASGKPVVAVDLSGCEIASRGVVDALPSAPLGGEPPDTQFLVTRGQLDCLRERIEDPETVLDPTARIDLSECRVDTGAQ
jgi:hypothetical protein